MMASTFVSISDPEIEVERTRSEGSNIGQGKTYYLQTTLMSLLEVFSAICVVIGMYFELLRWERDSAFLCWRSI